MGGGQGGEVSWEAAAWEARWEGFWPEPALARAGEGRGELPPSLALALAEELAAAGGDGGEVRRQIGEVVSRCREARVALQALLPVCARLADQRKVGRAGWERAGPPLAYRARDQR
jgi:hypothetical protein